MRLNAAAIRAARPFITAINKARTEINDLIKQPKYDRLQKQKLQRQIAALVVVYDQIVSEKCTVAEAPTVEQILANA